VHAVVKRAGLLVLILVLVPPASAAAPTNGRGLYDQGCVSCHGPDARGVEDKGPSLRGVGALAADFYLTTGYMPLHAPGGQPQRRDPSYTPGEIRALVAYIGSLGGPPVPRVRPERGSVRDGFRLFTENCAGCHQVAGAGGYVAGAVAPPLDAATPTQVAEAVRTGPYVMPRFTRSQISDRELDSLVAYVEHARHPDDRGGWSLGHLGPVTEGLVAWLLAGSLLVVLALVIGDRAREEE
jgi:ubiquinol-cytochrome c reductase cytochrome c subunit